MTAPGGSSDKPQRLDFAVLRDLEDDARVSREFCHAIALPSIRANLSVSRQYGYWRHLRLARTGRAVKLELATRVGPAVQLHAALDPLPASCARLSFGRRFRICTGQICSDFSDLHDSVSEMSALRPPRGGCDCSRCSWSAGSFRRHTVLSEETVPSLPSRRKRQRHLPYRPNPTSPGVLACSTILSTLCVSGWRKKSRPSEK